MERTTHPVEAQEERALLLFELGRALHVVQTPANQIVDTLQALAHPWGMDADLLLFQSYFGLELRTPGTGDSPGTRWLSWRQIPFEPHWRLERARQLHLLCDQLGRGQISVADARTQIRHILRERSSYPLWAVVVAYGLYSAAVAARIGGGAVELAVGGVVGLAAGAIHFGTLASERIDLLKTFLAGLVGTFVALVCLVVLPPFSFAHALFGGITLLVPAMVICIGTDELANDAVESGTIRLAYGLLRFLMLAVGVAAMVKAWTWLTPLPPMGEAQALPLGVVLTMLAVGGASLVLCLQAKPRDALPIIFAVLLAYGSQEILKRWVAPDGAPFVAAFILGAVAFTFGRRQGQIPGVILVPGLLQLAPGFLGTRSVLGLLEGARDSQDTFFHVFLIALQLVLGLVTASTLFHRRKGHSRYAAISKRSNSA